MKKLNIRVFCTFICLFMLFLGALSYVVRIGTRTLISLTGKTNSFTAWLFKDQPTLNNEPENNRTVKPPAFVDWISMYPFSDESLNKAGEISAAVKNSGSECAVILNKNGSAFSDDAKIEIKVVTDAVKKILNITKTAFDNFDT